MAKPTHIQIEGVMPGAEAIGIVAEMSPKVMVAFSGGKDSVATMVALCDSGKFKEIQPYYCYMVPDLQFVEHTLQYYEKFFGCKIARVPHPTLYRLLRSFVFQPIDRLPVIDAAHLGRFTYDQLQDWLRDDFGFKRDAYIASGIRSVDSMLRRLGITKSGPISRKRRMFYPIWDMTRWGVIELLKSREVCIPVDYFIFGRSFDGIDFRFLSAIKKYYPDDYDRILEFFPMADLEIFRAKHGLPSKLGWNAQWRDPKTGRLTGKQVTHAV